jgi:hypothetical protein
VADPTRIAAGWYPDPAGLPQLRWWDGRMWTRQTADAVAPRIPPADAPREPDTAPTAPTPVQSTPAPTPGGGASADPAPASPRPLDEVFDRAFGRRGGQPGTR